MAGMGLADDILFAELDALKITYGDDCTMVPGEPVIVAVTVSPYLDDRHTQQFVSATLTFEIDSKYPAKVPTTVLQNTKGLSDSRIAELKYQLSVQAKHLAGDVMLLQLCQLATDHLTSVNYPEGECAFCLCTLAQDTDDLTRVVKLPCYHCFHYNCFAQWWNWQQNEQAKRKQQVVQEYGYAAPMELQKQKLEPDGRGCFAVNCPVCRAEITSDAVNIASPTLLTNVTVNYSQPEPVDCTVKEDASWHSWQERFRDLYNRQQKKGGIIENKGYGISLEELNRAFADNSFSSTSPSAFSPERPESSASPLSVTDSTNPPFHQGSPNFSAISAASFFSPPPPPSQPASFPEQATSFSEQVNAQVLLGQSTPSQPVANVAQRMGHGLAAPAGLSALSGTSHRDLNQHNFLSPRFSTPLRSEVLPNSCPSRQQSGAHPRRPAPGRVVARPAQRSLQQSFGQVASQQAVWLPPTPAKQPQQPNLPMRNMSAQPIPPGPPQRGRPLPVPRSNVAGNRPWEHSTSRATSPGWSSASPRGTLPSQRMSARFGGAPGPNVAPPQNHGGLPVNRVDREQHPRTPHLPGPPAGGANRAVHSAPAAQHLGQQASPGASKGFGGGSSGHQKRGAASPAAVASPPKGVAPTQQANSVRGSSGAAAAQQPPAVPPDTSALTAKWLAPLKTSVLAAQAAATASSAVPKGIMSSRPVKDPAYRAPPDRPAGRGPAGRNPTTPQKPQSEPPGDHRRDNHAGYHRSRTGTGHDSRHPHPLPGRVPDKEASTNHHGSSKGREGGARGGGYSNGWGNPDSGRQSGTVMNSTRHVEYPTPGLADGHRRDGFYTGHMDAMGKENKYATGTMQGAVDRERQPHGKSGQYPRRPRAHEAMNGAPGPRAGDQGGEHMWPGSKPRPVARRGEAGMEATGAAEKQKRQVVAADSPPQQAGAPGVGVTMPTTMKWVAKGSPRAGDSK